MTTTHTPRLPGMSIYATRAKFHIKPKRDMGGAWLIDGKTVTTGYVVTDGACNVMPGATWFQTIPAAMRAIEVLMAHPHDSNAFWTALRKVQQ